MLLGVQAGMLLGPQLRAMNLIHQLQSNCIQGALRSASWVPRATAPSREARGGSSSSSRGRGGGSSSRSRGGGSGWNDSPYDTSRSSSNRGRSSSSRDGGWGGNGRGAARSSFGSGRGRGGSSSQEGSSDRQQQRQQWQRQPPQQQQRQWQESAQGSAGDDDSWTDDAYGDDYAADDGEFLYPARPSKASFKEQLFGEALYGVAPILAALQAGVRVPHVLLMQEGLSPQQRKDARALTDIQRLVIDRGATIRSVSKHELNMLAGNRPHQGLILDASPLQWQQLDVLLSPEDLQQQQQQEQQQQEGSSSSEAPQQQHAVKFPVWLALDEVMDPQNLGAMLRSAYCLGASGVLGCARNCAPLSPVVSKASAGAAELMTLHSCRSMPRTLADAAEKGWAVVGAAAEPGSAPVSAFRVDRPTVLVMGNEGYGLRPMVKRCCTQLVQIEMSPPSTSSSSSSSAGVRQQQLVDSLNVSVATGILLHQLLTTARQ